METITITKKRSEANVIDEKIEILLASKSYRDGTETKEFILFKGDETPKIIDEYDICDMILNLLSVNKKESTNQ